ncbi:MAG: hypothetical protein WAK93_09700 [Solirubrobacteraceae bacterium]
MRLKPHLTISALIFALGTAGAPAAAGKASSRSPLVRPNPDEQILIRHSRPVASRLASSRTVQPNPDEQAATSPTQSAGPRSEVIDNGGHGQLNIPPIIVRATVPTGGFDWGDAGIGAAAALGLSMIALAAGLAIAPRRARGTPQPPPV